jgi:hypothetical protein
MSSSPSDVPEYVPSEFHTVYGREANRIVRGLPPINERAVDESAVVRPVPTRRHDRRSASLDELHTVLVGLSMALAIGFIIVGLFFVWTAVHWVAYLFVAAAFVIGVAWLVLAMLSRRAGPG